MKKLSVKEVEVFGESLMLYRRRNKITSTELAKKHGISRATLWRIEAGKTLNIPITLHLELLAHSLAQAREDEREIVITQKYSQGKDEMYCEFFFCPKCQSAHVGIYDKYCSECGSKIKWLLASSKGDK